MGRGKLPLKLIPKERARRITFTKRRSGLIKKAYELSTLCDVKVCLIVNDYTNQPSEPVATWPKNPREVRALINDYITAMTLKPASKRLLTMADFLNDRIKKVNAETEKVGHTQILTITTTAATTKCKSIALGNGSYQEKLILGESYIAELSGNQLSEFASDLDNKIEQVNERMKQLIHIYHYNHFGMQEPLNGGSTSTYNVQPGFVQYYSPHDPYQAMAAATQMYHQHQHQHHHQLQFPYYNDYKTQVPLQQLPWIHDQPSSSSSKALIPFNPSSQTVSFDNHYNNGSFTRLLTSNDYAADEYYSYSTNGTALLDGQGDHGQYDMKSAMFNNNSPLVLESGGALHQNDQNGMMSSHTPMALQNPPYVNQPLLPLMPSSAASEWHYNQADPMMGFLHSW